MITRKIPIASFLLTCSLAMASASQAAEITLRLHHFAGPTTPVQTNYLEPWAERLEQQSNGAIKIELYPAMQLGGSAPSLYDQAKDGIVDISWTLLSYTPNRFPASEAFDLPFMPTTGEATSMAAHEYAMKHMQEAFDGVYPIAVFAHSPGKIHTKDTAINSVDDLSGLTIRAPSKTMNRYFSALGAGAIGMPFPQIPEAISRGVIDGLTLPYESATALGVLDIAKNHTQFEGEHGLYTAMMVLALNQRRYDSLPDELKKVIDNNSGLQEAQRIGQVMDEFERIEADKITHGEVEGRMTYIGSEELDPWLQAAEVITAEWIEDMNKRGHDGKLFYEDAQALIEKYTLETSTFD